MAGPGLPTNVDTTYADDAGDASVKAHQQAHDSIHGIVNAFDTAVGTATTGQVPTYDGAKYVPATPSGGSSGVPVVRPAVNDYLYMGGGSTASNTMSNNTWFGGPLILPAGTWDQVLLNIDTAGSTGATIKPVLYRDNNGRPGTVLYDPTAVSATAGGTKTFTVGTPFTTSAGEQIWAGAVSQGSPSTSPQLSHISNGNGHILSTTVPVAWYSVTIYQWVVNSLSGSASNNPTMGSQNISGVPRLAFRRSA